MICHYNARVTDEVERQEVEAVLRRAREEVRDRALLDESPRPAPSAPATAVRSEGSALPEPPPLELPEPPDASAVNEAWRAQLPAPPSGVRGRLARAVWQLLTPYVEAQVAFNSRQVQLDNAVLDYIGRRFAATHEQYDRTLGLHMRRMEEIDKRHLILQEEVVAHVHDLVQRIDLVLSETERGRMSTEFALRDIRNRLAKLEAELARPATP
jgi:hypothetical protein